MGTPHNRVKKHVRTEKMSVTQAIKGGSNPNNTMSIVVRAICRNIKLTDGSFDCKTMIITPTMTEKEFKSKLEVKYRTSLPDGQFSLAADIDKEETILESHEKVFKRIKGPLQILFFFPSFPSFF